MMPRELGSNVEDDVVKLICKVIQCSLLQKYFCLCREIESCFSFGNCHVYLWTAMIAVIWESYTYVGSSMLRFEP